MPIRLLVALLFTLLVQTPQAQQPPSAVADLADASAVVVTGAVEAMAAGEDQGAIYTYVTVRVDEVLKGAVPARTVVVKQLGGTLPQLGLYIADQARFAAGESVLLFLNSRPRDGSLYTVGLGRGKWTVLPDIRGGGLAAIQGSLATGLDDTTRAAIAASRPHAANFVAIPADAPTPDSPGYTFIPGSEGGPARWHQADDGVSVPVDFQTIPGGLPGDASAALNRAIGAWNGVGSQLQLARAQTGPHTCPSTGFSGNGRIGLYWNDPCGEIPDGDSATFGMGGGFFTPGFQKTINGVTFNAFVQGLAILNNSGPHLATAACLEDALTHVLGHAVGLGHSGDGNAVMYTTLRSSCTGGSTGLGTDDVNGLGAIYPDIPSGGLPPQAPTAITNTVSLDSVTLSWTPATSGGPAQSYILEAGTSEQQPNNIAVLPLPNANTSTVVGAVPPGVYYVRVRARNVLGTSALSPATVVTVGPCQAPAAPTGLAYTNADGFVGITWNPPASGVTQGYLLSAGMSPGASDALVLPLGPTPAFAGTAPPGDYYVRVAARNSCATGPASSPDLVVQVRACTAPPLAPANLSFTRAGNTVTLNWTGPTSGNLPSRYQIHAGSGPGASNILVYETTNPATSFQAFAPAGTYYVRIVSRNNCGSSSTASNEVQVVVP
ncbi:MAG: matrixin family metalloprotease [Acidobacteria bacterium]|nr:matrixin family metalloprotease [Acidobacteriota bacterium]